MSAYNFCHMEIPLSSTAVEQYGARPGFEPDVLELHPDILDAIPLDERAVFRQFEVGVHPDGSPQLITAFGGEHSHDPSSLLLRQTKDMCSAIVEAVTNIDSLTAFFEGRIREPDLSLSDEDIFAIHGELGLSEAKLRLAGAKDLRCFEPDNGALVRIAEELGFDAVSDYLIARMLPQWLDMSEAHRPPLPTYLMHTICQGYPEIALDPRNNEGGGAILGFQRRLNELGFPLLGEIVLSPELRVFMREQTTLLPALRVPRLRRTLMQQVAVAFNMSRQVSLINLAIDVAITGRDVVISCSDIHVRAATQAFEAFAQQRG